MHAVEAEKLLESDAAPETEQRELDSDDDENQEKPSISDWPTEQDLNLISMHLCLCSFSHVSVIIFFSHVFMREAS